MSQLVRISGDYGIRVDDGSTITLDTGLNVGEVIITGKLTVKGPTTTIETDNISISDNILYLNAGESGAGITLGSSGIEIDRGLLSNSKLFFDETIEWYNPLTDSDEFGSWILKDENEILQSLRLATISTSEFSDLVFDLAPGRIVRISGADAQEYSNLLNGNLDFYENAITNTRTLRDYVQSGTLTPGVADVDTIYLLNSNGVNIESRVTTAVNAIDFYIRENTVDDVLRASITNSGLFLSANLTVNGGTITTNASLVNLVNTTATTVNFAGAATDVQIGSTTGTTNVNNNLDVDGIVNIDGNILSTSQTAFNLLNSTATTVNFAGAATNLQIGSATGITNVNNNLDVDGDVNIDGLSLTVSSPIFNLANSTVSTVNFAGFATEINIGHSTGKTIVNHNLEVNGGELTTTSTTFDMINTTAETVNFAGDATLIEIGSTTGTTNINNNLDVDLNVNIDGSELTTSSSTFDLLNTDATTVNFAGDATDIQIGADTGTTVVNNDLDVKGNLYIYGYDDSVAGSIETNSTQFDLLNLTPTEINFGGNASNINIGTPNGSTTINDINISGNVISSVSSSDLLFENVLSLAVQTTIPDSDSAYLKVYSTDTPGPGGTGLYFVNTIGTNDELISKTKAFLYSLIL